MRHKVLVACEFSGVVRTAFCRKGFDAYSCDILPSEDGGPHICGDARDVAERGGWSLIIAHPPCTYLCNSGVRWLGRNTERWWLMVEGAKFFRFWLNQPCPVAVENPVMHRVAKILVGEQQTQIIQPWMFGHGETKATCLWLKGLPKLSPTKVVEGREGRIHKMSPGPERGKERSRTYSGIAEAMADQWGNHII